MSDLKNLDEIKENPPKKSVVISTKPKNFAYAEYPSNSASAAINPWTPVESLDEAHQEDRDVFRQTIDLCRFFYKTEPVIATVVNKLVEIGINDLLFKKNNLSENEFRIFTAIKPRLLEFSETMAQEFLLSGLVVPEISYGAINRDDLADFGIKKYQRLIAPVSMFVRDPKTISIETSMLTDTPSYYVEIPDDIIQFVHNKGSYDGVREDKQLFKNLKVFFPDFIKAINNGLSELPISEETSNLVLRRNYLTDVAYPISYIAPILDALQHKRQLRRMDYSLIDKVISAILHISVGSDEFPITESVEDQDMVTQLRNQMLYRFNNKRNLQRIFQLLTNHTVKLEWIFPDTTTLLDEHKYADINNEILFGLGFPQLLITGEASRSGASDPEIAMISPIKTMENFRRKIIKVVREICKEVAIQNRFSDVPQVEFKTLNLHKFADFATAMQALYQVSGVSRTSYAETLGFDFKTELDSLVEENTELLDSGLPQYGPSPFSANTPPNGQNTVPDNNNKNKNNTNKSATVNNKPDNSVQ